VQLEDVMLQLGIDGNVELALQRLFAADGIVPRTFPTAARLDTPCFKDHARRLVTAPDCACASKKENTSKKREKSCHSLTDGA
jgi:hypothetical protein